MESLIICGEFRYNWLNSVSPYLDQGCSDNKEGFSFWYLFTWTNGEQDSMRNESKVCDQSDSETLPFTWGQVYS